MIAITHKTSELDKPGWIAALTDAHTNKGKVKYIIIKNISENQRSQLN